MKSIYKNILWVLLLALLALPAIQMFTGFANEKKLKGAVVNSTIATFSWKGWFEESYQEQTEDYVNDNFGFRPDFVRFNNQVDYTLFGKLNAHGVIIGKENFLYEENYIKAYKGMDFIGNDSIEKRVFKLKMIQDTLEKLNKEIVVLMAIGKASYFPEYFPAKWDSIPQGTTNYEVYMHAFEKHSIKHLDFHKWFRKMKDTSTFPLYAKCGIHWSEYGEFLAADSLLKYSQTLLKRPVAQLELEHINVKKENSKGDYDIGQGLNLMYAIDTYPMAYPKFHIKKPDNYEAPTGLFVADSYYWGMFNWGMSRDIFNDGEFWFYNHQIYPDCFQQETLVQDVDLKQKIEENDIIFLVTTDANLFKFAFGFIEESYRLYYPEKAIP